MSNSFQSLTNKTKIVICTADVGCGHGRAAQAVQRAIRDKINPVSVKILDALSLTPDWFNRVYRDMYLAVAKFLPRLNGWMYDKSDLIPHPGQGGVALSMESYATRKLWNDEQIRHADLIICTHFLCARVLSRLKGKGMLNAQLAVVITDQHPHAVWRVPNADLFFVASDQARDVMIENGFSEDKIIVTGIPIDTRFENQLHRDMILARHQIPGNKKIILITGGGLGLGGLDQALNGAITSGDDVHIIVVCGRNEQLYEKLIHEYREMSARCTILGLTTRMHELMFVADLMIGKPGGLTTSEATAVGLPMILLRPLPGQEERNAAILVKADVAELIESPYDAGVAASKLLNCPSRLQQLRNNALRFGKPQSAKTVALSALKLLPNAELTISN